MRLSVMSFFTGLISGAIPVHLATLRPVYSQTSSHIEWFEQARVIQSTGDTMFLVRSFDVGRK